MVVPRAWCTRDPRPCAEAIGIIEILLSVVGALMLITLPFVMLDMDHEFDYIQLNLHGVQIHSGVSLIPPRKQNWTLNITEIFRRDCYTVAHSMLDYLEEYLKKKFKYWVHVNRTEAVTAADNSSTRILCEFHVESWKNPKIPLVQIKKGPSSKKYSIAIVCGECINKFTGEAENSIVDRMQVIAPSNNEISNQVLYPVSVGTDAERVACLYEKLHLQNTNKSDVLETEQRMYRWLGASAGTALCAGFVVTSTAFIVTRFLITVAFLLEGASAAFLALGLMQVNEPSMCLYQYGGISVYAQDSPKLMQTIITYSGLGYVAGFKLFLMWFLVAYAERASRFRDDGEFPKQSEYVKEVAVEVNQMNMERGGEPADNISSVSSGEEEEEKEVKNGGTDMKREERGGEVNLKKDGARVITIEQEEKKMDPMIKMEKSGEKPKKKSAEKVKKKSVEKPKKKSAERRKSVEKSKRKSEFKSKKKSKKGKKQGKQEQIDDVFESPEEESPPPPSISKYMEEESDKKKQKARKSYQSLEHTIVPQTKRDKKIFATSFFGGNY